MLPLLSARPAVAFPAAEHHRPLAGTKIYCLATEAWVREKLAQTMQPRLITGYRTRGHSGFKSDDHPVLRGLRHLQSFWRIFNFFFKFTFADECIQSATVAPDRDSPACRHEYHTLGTSDHVTAALKLAVLCIVLLSNVRTATVFALETYTGGYVMFPDPTRRRIFYPQPSTEPAFNVQPVCM